MKSRILILLLLLCGLNGLAQTPPKLYINIVSQNAPSDSLNLNAPFQRMKPLVLEFADIVLAKGAKWNLGTCDGFVEGLLQFQNAGTSTTDLLESITTGLYTGVVEIDPQRQNSAGRNIADLVYLIDSCGTPASRNVSGFIYASTQVLRPDWEQYKDTIKGNVYPRNWKAELVWGAESLPMHTDDLNDYGIWQPDTSTNFYQHNPNGRIWYQGSGCQPVQTLDSLEDEQLIIAQIKGAVDSIQNGLWDNDLFYCYSVQVDQNQFGPMLFAKLGAIMDSVRSIGGSKIEWATLTEKQRAFYAWRGTSGNISQWSCGQPPVASEDPSSLEATAAYPNPFSHALQFRFPDGRPHQAALYNMCGQLLMDGAVRTAQEWSTVDLQPGLYIVVIDGKEYQRLLKY